MAVELKIERETIMETEEQRRVDAATWEAHVRWEEKNQQKKSLEELKERWRMEAVIRNILIVLAILFVIWVMWMLPVD